MHRLGNVAATEFRGPVWAWRRWVLVTATIFGGLVSARLDRADLRAPFVFVAVGAILPALGPVGTSSALANLQRLGSGGLCVG